MSLAPRIAWRHLRAARPPRWTPPLAAAGLVLAVLGGAALLWSEAQPVAAAGEALTTADLVGLGGVLVTAVGLLVLAFALIVRVFTLLVAITCGSVGAGCAALVIVLSLLNGLEADLQQRLLGHRAHLRISAPPGEEIVAPAPLARRLRAVPGVVGVSAALEGPIMIRSGFGRAGVRLVGVDPRDHAGASRLPDEVVEGDYRAFVDRTLLPPRAFPGFSVAEPDEPAEPDAGPSDVPQNSAEETGLEEHLLADADTGDEGGWEDPEQEIPRLRAQGAIPPARPPAAVPDSPVSDEEDDGGGWEDPEQEIPRLRAQGAIPPARPPVGPSPDDATDQPAGDPDAPAAGAPDAGDADQPFGAVVPVLIGVELAGELGIGAGDPVQLITPEGRITPAGLVPGVLAARVAGVYATGVYQDDRDYVYLPLADAQAFLRAPDAVTAITVRLADPEVRADERAAIVAAAGDGFVVEDWRQIHRGLFSAMFLEKIAMSIGLLFVVMVAAFGILSTNMMSVMERSAEIAILKAMGASGRLIARVFGLAGMIVGVLGCSGGLAAGLALCLWFGERGVPLRSDAFTLQALPLRPEPGEVALIAAAALVLVGLASVLPARAAAALRPVDGLRRGE